MFKKNNLKGQQKLKEVNNGTKTSIKDLPKVQWGLVKTSNEKKPNEKIH